MVVLLALGLAPIQVAAASDTQTTPAQVAKNPKILRALHTKHAICSQAGSGFRCHPAGKPLPVVYAAVTAGHACVASTLTAAVVSCTPPSVGDEGTAKTAVRQATTDRFTPGGFIWQSFTQLDCHQTAASTYLCSFTSAVSGTAQVVFTASGPRVTFLTLACTGAYQGRPECALP